METFDGEATQPSTVVVGKVLKLYLKQFCTLDTLFVLFLDGLVITLIMDLVELRSNLENFRLLLVN